MSLIIIGGLFKGRRIKTLPSLSTRPSSSKCRAALFNICQAKVDGAMFLDLYAGSGAMGIEALSRKALFSIFIENNKKAVKCIYENLELLSLEKSAQVITGDVLTSLRKVKKKADIVYVDPPYEFYKKEKFINSILEGLVFFDLLNDNCSIFFEMPSSFSKEMLEKSLCKGMEFKNIRKYGATMLLEILFCQSSYRG